MMFAIALSVFLALWNNLANLTRVYQRWYVPVNIALTGLLLWTARVRGLTPDDLGIVAPGAGLRWGGIAAAAVAVTLAAMLVSPLGGVLRDARIARLSPAGLAYQAVVRIPLGTAVWEEVAFRGVLLAALATQVSTAAAVVISSAVFGVWHVTPTIVALNINGVAGDPRRRTAAVLGAIAVTFAAGIVLCLLRLLSGSLLAPLIAHVATNSLGSLASAWTARGTGGRRRVSTHQTR